MGTIWTQICSIANLRMLHINLQYTVHNNIKYYIFNIKVHTHSRLNSTELKGANPVTTTCCLKLDDFSYSTVQQYKGIRQSHEIRKTNQKLWAHQNQQDIRPTVEIIGLYVYTTSTYIPIYLNWKLIMHIVQ